MAVELDGSVRMRGDRGPGAVVQVIAENGRLRIVAGNELVGDWTVSEIGVSVLQDGFSIRAEGEELLLRTQDDVALAEEIGVATASPRLARRLAARHNPVTPESELDSPKLRSNLPAIGYAVAGALVVLGGTFLNIDGSAPDATTTLGAEDGVGFDFWLAFLIGGALMVAVAFVMSIGARTARIVAVSLVLALIAVFAVAVSEGASGTTEITAYGFIAGGLVVGVAVLVGASSSPSD